MRHWACPGEGGHTRPAYPSVVIAAPVPIPPVPKSVGRGSSPTTRNRPARMAPSESVAVTRTREPIRAPTVRMVEAPRAIWSSPAGSRPSAADSSIGPRTAVAAMARTLTRLTVTAGSETRVIRPIARSPSSSLIRGSWPMAPGPALLKKSW